MAEAVDEFAAVFDYKHKRGWNLRYAYDAMKYHFTYKERGDWFKMYTMGGIPYRHNSE